MRSIFSTAAAVFFAAVNICSGGELLEKARSGDAESQFVLGTEYFSGTNRQVNTTLACHWFRKAADSLPEAQYNFAICLFYGIGCEKNPAAAFMFFNKARDGGIIKAAIRSAEMLLSGVGSGEFEDVILPEVKPDPVKASEILLPFSEADQTALLMLAKIYFADAMTHGRDLRELLEKYMQKNADHDPEVLVIYSACLRSGIGGFTPEPEKSAAILQMAADKDHPEAIAQLAEVLYGGFGIKRDRERAMALNEKAISLGSPRAMVNTGDMKLAGFDMPHDPHGAYLLFAKAAEKNYPPALRKLGDCCLSGIGTPADVKQALGYYFRAAEAGDAQAAFILGTFHRDGKHLPIDNARAFAFFRQAALEGHAEAMREAGLALIEGKGVEADAAHGMEILRHAAEAGDLTAADLLR